MPNREPQSRHQRMTTAPIEKLVLSLAGPSIVVMLITAIYNMADTFFVGTIGTSATAAVGVVFSLMSFVQALGFFFGHGAGNTISRQLGAKNLSEASRMAATGFFSALITGSVVAVAGLLFLEPLALLLGSTPTILPYACAYMVYILLAAPAMAGSLMLNNLLRFQGSTFHGMVGMITGGILNICLDPLFIYVFKMGVAGAGLATMVSQYVSLILLFLMCERGDNIHIRPKEFSPSRHAYKEMLRGGTPSLFRQGIASVSVLIFNQVAGNYGDAAIAAMSIVTRCTQFASSALIGFGQGFQPVCGFNYGAGLYKRVRDAFWFCVRVCFIFLAVIAVGAFIFAPQIIGVFRDDAEVIKIGTLALRLQCFMLPFMSYYVMGNMMLQTMGMAVRASILAMARQGLFLVPLVLALTPFWGVFGLQIAPPVSDLLSVLLSIPLAGNTLRMLKLAPEKPQGPAGG